MPRKRIMSPSNIEDFDDDFDDENSSNGMCFVAKIDRKIRTICSFKFQTFKANSAYLRTLF